MLTEILQRAMNLGEMLQKAFDSNLLNISKHLEAVEINLLHQKLSMNLSVDVLGKTKAFVSQNNRCYAVKDGVDVLLDVSRKTLRETTDDLYEYVEALSKSTGLSMKLKYSAESGFFFQFPKSPGSQSFPSTIHIQSETNNIARGVTLEILKLNQRVKESLEEIFLLTDKHMSFMLDEARSSISHLYTLSENLGLLDYICSASQYAKSGYNSIKIVKVRIKIL